MSLPFLLSCRPVSTQGSASKLRSGGAGSKASYGGGRSSLDASASKSKGCKRRLAALPEEEIAHVPWQELEDCVNDDDTAIEEVHLKRVGVVGLQESLATQLVECFAAKPSVVDVGVHHGPKDGTCGKFDIMPGVTVLPTARDVCAWSDIIFLCGTYEDTNGFLRTHGANKALQGKCILQLRSGTPEEAITASLLAKNAGARYLDAFVFSEGLSHVFNHRLSAMMVSGDKKAWREVEAVVCAAAPASFYGGRRVEWANTIGVGVVTFLASVRMGLNQAQLITRKFGLPPHVMPRVLSSGYMRVVKSLMSGSGVEKAPDSESRQTSPGGRKLPADSATNTDSDLRRGLNALHAGTCVDPSEDSAAPSSVHGIHACAHRLTGAAVPPSEGSQEWVAQLERIRDVCRKAQVEHSVIDGFLAASRRGPRFEQSSVNAHEPLVDVLAASHSSQAPVQVDGEHTSVSEPFEHILGSSGGPGRLDFDLHEVLMDTDMVGDDILVAAWAP